MNDSIADEAIGQACTLLTAALHCRRQSAELKNCLAASGSAGCAHAQQAFATCSHEHASEVISSLVSVASAHCKAEVAAFAAYHSIFCGCFVSPPAGAVMRRAGERLIVNHHHSFSANNRWRACASFISEVVTDEIRELHERKRKLQRVPVFCLFILPPPRAVLPSLTGLFSFFLSATSPPTSSLAINHIRCVWMVS